MKTATVRAVGLFALMVALLAAPLAGARDFSRTYSKSADRTFVAILRLVQSDSRVHLIDYDGDQRLIHFRLALDPSDPDSPLDQFSGMWVLLQVAPERQGDKEGARALVTLTADRIFPTSAHGGNVRAEESTFAKDFWKQLERELKR
jgi:hypothetical protein